MTESKPSGRFGVNISFDNDLWEQVSELKKDRGLLSELCSQAVRDYFLLSDDTKSLERKLILEKARQEESQKLIIAIESKLLKVKQAEAEKAQIEAEAKAKESQNAELKKKNTLEMFKYLKGRDMTEEEYHEYSTAMINHPDGTKSDRYINVKAYIAELERYEDKDRLLITEEGSIKE